MVLILRWVLNAEGMQENYIISINVSTDSYSVRRPAILLYIYNINTNSVKYKYIKHFDIIYLIVVFPAKLLHNLFDNKTNNINNFVQDLGMCRYACFFEDSNQLSLKLDISITYWIVYKIIYIVCFWDITEYVERQWIT